MIDNYCQTLTGAAFGEGHFPNVLDNGVGWLGLIALGMLASVMVLALTYMASRFLTLPKLEAWSRFEIYQLVATGVLALVIASWVWGMCNWDLSILDSFNKDANSNTVPLYSKGPGKGIIDQCESSLRASGNMKMVTPYCAAQAYLEKTRQRGSDIFQTLMFFNAGFSYVTQIRWESRPLGIGYTLEPLAGFQQLQNVVFVTLSGFMVSYLSILVQMRVLDFFLVAVPFYFIPLGVLLRGLPPTRQFGGALVGFGVASLFFFPLILVFDDLMISAPLENYVGPYTLTVQEMQNAQGENDQTRIRTGWTPTDLSRSGNFYKGAKIRGQDGQDYYIVSIFEQSRDYLKFEDEKGDIIVFKNEQNPDGTASMNVYREYAMFDPQVSGKSINDAMGAYTGLDAGGKPIENPVPASTRAIDFFSSPGQEKTSQYIGMSDRTDMLARWIFWPARMVMIYLVAAIVLPVINFMVYIEIARVATKFMGAEMDLTNLTRLI